MNWTAVLYRLQMNTKTEAFDWGFPTSSRQLSCWTEDLSLLLRTLVGRHPMSECEYRNVVAKKLKLLFDTGALTRLASSRD